MYPEKIQKAILLAANSHKDQKRKILDTPYITHPLTVMYIVSTISSDIDILCASVLHDVVEDTNVTLDQVRVEFGEKVSYYVDFLSEDNSLPFEERKEKYFSRMISENNNDVFLIKSADVLYNLRDTISSIERLGLKEVKNGFVNICSYVENQGKLINSFERLWLENPLLTQLKYAQRKAQLLLDGQLLKKETSCGIVPYSIGKFGERKYLLVEGHHGGISFPKGHVEEGETYTQTAERELLEETSLICSSINKQMRITEKYLVERPDFVIDKEVHYFVGLCPRQEVKIQEEEIKSATWLNEKKCLEKINHQESKEVFRRALRIINK